MGRSSSGRVVGLVDAKGAAGIDAGARERWSVVFTFAAWKAVGGEVVVDPRRCRMPVSFRSLTGWMERIQPYAIVEVEAGRKGRDGATILGRIAKVGVEDAELEGVAAALKKPIILVHPGLGRFKYHRRSRCYEGRVKWNGRKVELSLDSADPDRPGPAVVVAERLFAGQADWNRRVDDLIIERLLDRWNEGWRMEDQARITSREFLARIALESIDVGPEGSVSFWYSDGDLFCGHSIVVYGTIDQGPTDVDTPG